MALPNSITSTTPLGSDLPSTIDDQIRALKLAVQDILGIPNATAISAAGLNYVAGGLDRVIFQDAAGSPASAGRLNRNGANLEFHDGTAARVLANAANTVTLTNKTIDLTSNTLTGTTAQFNTALSDNDFATLAGAEALTNKTLTSPVLNTGVSGTAVLDEDDMVSNSATKVATQQSIKAYVDTRSVLATEQASTSGTAINFTTIPAGTKRITVMFIGVSISDASSVIVRLGDSGGVETSGYVAAVAGINSSGTAQGSSAHTDGFPINSTQNAAHIYNGSMILTLEDASDFTWVGMVTQYESNSNSMSFGSGRKSLSAELDRVQVTTPGGTATFDAGAINISYGFS